MIHRLKLEPLTLSTGNLLAPSNVSTFIGFSREAACHC